MKKESKVEQSVTVEQQPCPHCGYCPHCGRSNQPQPYYVPWYPHPNSWWVPSWVTNPGNTTITFGEANLSSTAQITDATAYDPNNITYTAN